MTEAFDRWMKSRRMNAKCAAGRLVYLGWQAAWQAVSAVGHPRAISEISTLRAENARLTADHRDELAELFKERDAAEDMADQLAAQIAAITGVDIGEHSSANCPWRNALMAAAEFGPGPDEHPTWRDAAVAEKVRRIAVERSVLDLKLCESQRLVMRPGQVYRFVVDPTCAECQRIAALTDAPPGPLPVGLLSAEPRRVAKLAKPNRDRDERVAPMAEAGVTKHDVSAFWRAQPFDLALPNDNGTTPLGNCDLCFLKGAAKVMRIIRDEPERAVWWARQEQRISEIANKPSGARFRDHRPTYTTMHAAWTGSLQDLLHGQSPAELLAGLPGDELEDCECTD